MDRFDVELVHIDLAMDEQGLHGLDSVILNGET